MTKRLCDSLVGASDLAEVLDITPRRLSQLVRQGVIPKQGRGKYALGACLQAYIAYRERVAGPDTDDDSPDLKEEQARYYRAKADREEMRARSEAGELIPADTVRAALEDVILTARAHLAAAGSKAAARFPDPAKAQKIIDQANRDALEALADREIRRALADAKAA